MNRPIDLDYRADTPTASAVAAAMRPLLAEPVAPTSSPSPGHKPATPAHGRR